MARLLALLSFLLSISVASAQTSWPNQREGDVVLKDFRFDSGETLGELKLHYTTLGTPQRDASGDDRPMRCCSCTAPTVPARPGCMPGIANELFGAGQPLDAERYFVILPTASGAAARASRVTGCACDFPHYRYGDMIRASHRLVTEGLGVKHLRLVLGASMGGMHTWLWGGLYPGFHGRSRADRQPAGRDQRAQLALPAHRHRGDSQRPRLERAATTTRTPRITCAPHRSEC